MWNIILPKFDEDDAVLVTSDVEIKSIAEQTALDELWNYYTKTEIDNLVIDWWYA